MRSIKPLASSLSAAMSSNWYFSELLPQLITRTFLDDGSGMVLLRESGFVGPSGALEGGDRRHVHDVLHAAAAGQVVDALGHPLQHRTHGLGSGQALDQFIADVAGVQVREDQDVGFA